MDSILIAFLAFFGAVAGSIITNLTYRRQIQFTKLHEKRAEVIENMYVDIINLLASLEGMAIRGFFSGKGVPTYQERIDIAYDNYKKFSKDSKIYGIYFNLSTREYFNKIDEQASTAIYEISSAIIHKNESFIPEGQSRIELNKKIDILFEQANNRIRKIIMPIENQLLVEFQNLLGV